MTTTVFNWANWGYSIIQHQQAANWVTSSDKLRIPNFHPTMLIEQVLIAVLLAFCVGWLFITFKLYYVFGWTTYKEMGADVEVRNVLYLYHIYILLLKIDVFFFLGFSFQFAWLVLNNEDPVLTLGLTAVQIHLLISIPGALIMLLFAYFAVNIIKLGPERKEMVSLCSFTGFYRRCCLLDYKIIWYLGSRCGTIHQLKKFTYIL